MAQKEGKRGKNSMRDFELENLAVDDIRTALEYIGKKVRSKNLFLADSKSKKSDSLNSIVPIFFFSRKNPNNPQ